MKQANTGRQFGGNELTNDDFHSNITSIKYINKVWLTTRFGTFRKKSASIEDYFCFNKVNFCDLIIDLWNLH